MSLPHLKDSDVNNNGSLNNYYTNGIVIILYYMPGCGWCKKFKPDFVKASQMATKQYGENVQFVMVDITTPEGSSIQNKINNMSNPYYIVRGVPKVVGYKNGRFYAVYAQGSSNYRTAGDVLQFVEGIRNNVPVEKDVEASS